MRSSRPPTRRATADPVIDLHRRIAAALAANGTTTLLVAGDLPDALRAALPPSLQVHSEPASLSDGSNAPPLMVAGVPVRTALMIIEDPGIDAAIDRRLGTACRRFPGRLLVWSRTTGDVPVLPATRFFAHGFRCILDDADDAHRETLYEYRLADYKQPPDWLNARFWANPERFAEGEP